MNDRPDPQKLLEAIKREEAQLNKGRLKIFLGMAAGVGKTYSMLEEAQVLTKEGVNLLVGVIESHGRKETEILLKNLSIVPKKVYLYKEREFSEMDVDAIIALNPSIVLVDELAHTNIPGARNEKRWQDVLEILDAGISVHSTLNVQHIESLSDIVGGITEIAVRETVPDLMIEIAHTIQLIDLSPDALLQRLKEGKVYTTGQSTIAVLNFFQKNKLTALREMVLRYVADKIDVELKRLVTTIEGAKEGTLMWKTHEKFLVAISHSPSSQKLIRRTRRLAAEINASWVSVYVNTGKILSPNDEQQLERNLKLTQSLGAENITIFDPDITEGIKRVAIERGITQIVIGRTPVNFFSLLQGPTVIDRLSAECKDIDLHVIRQDSLTVSSFNKKLFPPFVSKFSDYFLVVFLVGVMGAFSFVALYLLGYRVVEFLFFLGISALNLFFKQGPVILAAVLFFVIWGFYFIPAPDWASFSTLDAFVLLSLYAVTSVFAGTLLKRNGKRKDPYQKWNKKLAQLNEIIQYLDNHPKPDVVFIFLEETLPKVVPGKYKFLININGIPNLEGLKAKEQATAHLAIENEQETGWSTDKLPFSENLYIPLKRSQGGIMGLLIYTPLNERPLNPEEKDLLNEVCKKLTSIF